MNSEITPDMKIKRKEKEFTEYETEKSIIKIYTDGSRITTIKEEFREDLKNRFFF